MKILDRYIIKQFLSTFVFSIILIIGLAVVIDITEKLEDFIEKDAPMRAIVFDYYLNFIPYYTNLFMFLFIFISVIFFTSKMASNTEIIAIISSGISFKRFLYPYFISALILAVASFFLSNFIIPKANKVRLEFEDTYINGTFYNSERNIHKQIEPGIFIFMENFNTRTNTGNRFTIEKFENKKLVSKLTSHSITWDSTIGKWEVSNYYIRDIKDNKETLTKGNTLDTLISISPIDFQRRDTEKAKMDYYELNEFIDMKILRGETDTANYLIEKHIRIAFPFSTFILTLIGVSLSSQKKRGGAGLNIGLGLLLSFAYIFFMQLAQQFSLKGNLPPVVSAWIPNAVFMVIAFFLYRIAPK